MTRRPGTATLPHTDEGNEVDGARIWKAAIALALLASFAIVAHALWQDWQLGGNSWRQGDWLINQDALRIRRGPFGSAFLAGLRATDLPVLGTLIAFQAGLLTLFYALLWRALARINPPVIGAFVLLSCGVVVVFWGADPPGALRKEILGMIALVIGLGALARPGVARIWGAVALLALAGFAHEANTLFAPTLATLIWLATDRPEHRPHRWPAVSATLALAALGLGYALAHMRVEDAGAVCAPLLRAGVVPGVCEGAIRWLEFGVKDSVIEMSRQVLHPRPMLTVALGYALALAPFAVLGHLTNRMRLFAVLGLVTALPFVPLFLLSVDWGRWLSLHLFSYALILLALFQSGHLLLLRAPRPGVTALLLVPALFYGIGHVWTPRYGGLVWSVCEMLLPF